MPEKKVVVFDTRYQTSSGTNTLSAFLQREIEFDNVLQSQIAFQSNGLFVNNKNIPAGNAVINMKNELKIDLSIDNEGNLIVSGENANNYSLDNQGNLIYTYR